MILNIVVKLVDDWSQLSHAPAVAALAAGSVAAASSKPKAKGASKIKPPRALAWLKALRSA